MTRAGGQRKPSPRYQDPMEVWSGPTWVPPGGSLAVPFVAPPPGCRRRTAQLAPVSPRPSQARDGALQPPNQGLSLPTFLPLPRDGENLAATSRRPVEAKPGVWPGRVGATEKHLSGRVCFGGGDRPGATATAEAGGGGGCPACREQALPPLRVPGGRGGGWGGGQQNPLLSADTQAGPMGWDAGTPLPSQVPEPPRFLTATLMWTPALPPSSRGKA